MWESVKYKASPSESEFCVETGCVGVRAANGLDVSLPGAKTFPAMKKGHTFRILLRHAIKS